MARMQGVEPHEAGWSTRLVYWFVKRGLYRITGKASVPEPIKITAHHAKLLRAFGKMEGAHGAATSFGAGGAQSDCRHQSRDARRLSILNGHRFCVGRKQNVVEQVGDGELGQNTTILQRLEGQAAPYGAPREWCEGRGR
jgi:hypothetical protein